MILNQDRLLEIYEYAMEVWRSDLTEKEQYNRIFSPAVSQSVCRLLPGFDWYDPDTSYQEDVDAFMYEFEARMSSGT
jgi:hypothetical protein